MIERQRDRVRIASTAGIGWLRNMETLGPLLGTPDFAAARAWCEAHPTELAERVRPLEGGDQRLHGHPVRSSSRRQGIRINCFNPGPTDTPMMPSPRRPSARTWTTSRCRSAATRAEEQAWPLVFLNSPRVVRDRVQLDADGGFRPASPSTGRWPTAESTRGGAR